MLEKWHTQEISQFAVGEADPSSLALGWLPVAHQQHPVPEGHSMSLWAAKLGYFEFAVSKMKQK